MLLQISLQRWMVFYELLIFYQGRILPKLLGGFPVVVQELVETGQLTTGGVAVARRVVTVAVAVMGVFTAVQRDFLRAGSGGHFFGFLPDSRGLLQGSVPVPVPRVGIFRLWPRTGFL